MTKGVKSRLYQNEKLCCICQGHNIYCVDVNKCSPALTFPLAEAKAMLKVIKLCKAHDKNGVMPLDVSEALKKMEGK